MWSTPVIESLDEAVSFYLEDCAAKGMSPSTLLIKQRSLRRFLNWCEPHAIDHPSVVNLDVMEGFRHHLHHYKKQKDGEPLSINSQYRFLIDVKLFLRRLYQRHIIQHVDFESFELPKCQRRLPSALLSFDEVERVFALPALRGDLIGIRDRAILELFYASAIRRSELVRLQLNHIDLEQHTLMVVKGKGMRDRRIPIAQRSCDWVKRYLLEVRPVFQTIETDNNLFIGQKGLPINPHKVGDMVSKYIRRSGVDKPGSCHLFRHSAATSMLDAGADIRYIQELLGHADISTTQIYTHVAIKQLGEVYRRTHPAARSNADISPH